MFIEAINAGLLIVKSSLNYSLMTMSLTNLLAMSITRMSSQIVDILWKQMELYTGKSSPNLQVLKECFKDARKIAKK
jgi:hypothetical protein